MRLEIIEGNQKNSNTRAGKLRRCGRHASQPEAELEGIVGRKKFNTTSSKEGTEHVLQYSNNQTLRAMFGEPEPGVGS